MRTDIILVGDGNETSNEGKHCQTFEKFRRSDKHQGTDT